MAVSDLTIECRAIAARMKAWANVGGHAGILVGLATHDERTVYAMRDLLDVNPNTPGGMVAGLDNVCEHMRDAVKQNGVLAFIPRMASDGDKIIAGADVLDTEPGGPREVGITAAIGRAVKPLVMLAEASRPLDAAMVDGVAVRVEGSGWESLDGIMFTIEVANVPLAQFYLVEGDTSAETVGAGAGATIWLMP